MPEVLFGGGLLAAAPDILTPAYSLLRIRLTNPETAAPTP